MEEPITTNLIGGCGKCSGIKGDLDVLLFLLRFTIANFSISDDYTKSPIIKYGKIGSKIGRDSLRNREKIGTSYNRPISPYFELISPYFLRIRWNPMKSDGNRAKIGTLFLPIFHPILN